MLSDLAIENLALFERAALAFAPGLNVITGETGAGKSLLIDALELLLGERARAGVVRKGASEARVEGRFEIAPKLAAASEVRAFFARELPAVLEEWDAAGAQVERELILARAVNEAGKSRAWVNHRPVTQRVLRELAGLLVEIHGQNEHQRLLETAEQTRLLDSYGELDVLLARYRERRVHWIELAERVQGFERAARERADRLDLLRFQARELNDAQPNAEEAGALLDERERLRHSSELSRDLGRVLGELSGEDGAALDALRHAQRTLDAWRAKIGELAGPFESVNQALEHTSEAAEQLERFLVRVEASPERLEQVEERLYRLETLSKKYRTDVAGLAARAAELTAELAQLEGGGRDLDSLRAELRAARGELGLVAEELGKARKKLVPRLRKDVQSSLAELGLEKASFDVRISARSAAHERSPNVGDESAALLAEQRVFALDGADAIEFLLAANPGEDAQPLRHVASGGEAARIMLALRTALATRQTIPTLVFDEVDSGVGGRLGPKVGEHLRALGGKHQILCVTHLPAIAALAGRHFKVTKHVAAGRTSTQVSQLGGEARVEEVADMIAGGAAHATARAEAMRLLGAR